LNCLIYLKAPHSKIIWQRN